MTAAAADAGVGSAALAFDGITKEFAGRREAVRALDEFRLEVRRHQFTAIVGPSGCGKSTLLHIAAGLDTQFEGRLVSSVERREVAYVFQQPRLLPWLSIEDNVQLVLRARGVDARAARDRARGYLELVRLAGFERRFPGELSGGMQQRAALARALAIEPQLLLMDEPFGALDELTARRLRRELLELYADAPRTVLFVTHNVTEAVFLADQVVVVTPRPGRVAAVIPIDLPRPRDYDSAEVAARARHVVDHLEL
jgi:NitT/TauT family transport system ATP-binding protein